MTTPEKRDLKPPMELESAGNRIDAVLQAKPPVEIPASFAAKVTALAIAQSYRTRRRTPQFGRSTAMLLAPLVAATLFALAPHSSPHVRNIIFDTEVILIVQLALIGWWFTRTPSRQIQSWL